MSISIPTYITNLILKMAVKKAIARLPEIKKSVFGENKGALISYREEEDHKSVIVFIHGFSGDPEATFANVPELLMQDNLLDGYDLFSAGYSSSILPDIAGGFWSANPDITKLSNYFLTLLRNRFKKYERITLLAHSMGGLVLQRAILSLEPAELSKITNVILFGTPSNGLNMANSWISRLVKRQTRDMGSKSDFITSLRSDWEEKFYDQDLKDYKYNFDFRTVAGNSDDFIKQESSLAVFHERYHSLIPGNHINMVKANSIEDKENLCYQLIVSRVSPFNTTKIKSDPFSLNQFIAERTTYVNQHSTNIEGLSAGGLKKLTLALDSLGREQEAINILEQHSLTKTNTDLMGILAGRYKRKYLYAGMQAADGDKSFDLYKLGFTTSQNLLEQANSEQEDSDLDKEYLRSQVYYHAINLAFLSLVYKDEKAAMKSYANIALDHCLLDSKNIWEMATVAEANVYLENDDMSKTYYEKYVKETDNRIRERASTYINAKFAFQSIKGID